MPFEAGLAVASFLAGSKRRWYLLESDSYRLQKSLSDLNGYEVNIHEGTIQGMIAVLLTFFHIVEVSQGRLSCVLCVVCLRERLPKLRNKTITTYSGHERLIYCEKQPPSLPAAQEFCADGLAKERRQYSGDIIRIFRTPS